MSEIPQLQGVTYLVVKVQKPDTYMGAIYHKFTKFGTSPSAIETGLGRQIICPPLLYAGYEKFVTATLEIRCRFHKSAVEFIHGFPRK